MDDALQHVGPAARKGDHAERQREDEESKVGVLHAEDDRTLRRAPKEIFIEASSGLLNCDRG